MNVYNSNYRYTPRISNLIESFYQDRILSIKDLANILNVSPSYVYFLIKKLKSDMYFTVKAVPHYKKVKLSPLTCFLSIESTLYRDVILKVLSQHNYVIYIAPYYGGSKGVYCVFLVPSGREGDVKTFFELLLSYGIVKSYSSHSIITTRNIVMGFEWYDFSKDVWYFDWSSLLDEILLKIDDEPKLFDDFKTPTSYAKFDFYDLFILHHLEYDIFTNIGALASKIKVTPQNLSYHYKTHVHNLIKMIKPYWVPISLEHSTFFVSDITFENNKALNGFVEALQRKPIAYSYAPYDLSSHPSIVLTGILPYREFLSFVNLLDSLRDYDIVRDHTLYILSTEMSAGKALPYNCYDGSEWCFDLEPCIEEVLRLIKQAHKGMARLARAVDRSIESK